jgi:hypothetical protein
MYIHFLTVKEKANLYNPGYFCSDTLRTLNLKFVFMCVKCCRFKHKELCFFDVLKSLLTFNAKSYTFHVSDEGLQW